MNEGLSIAVAVASLAAAAWSGVATLRHRPPGISQFLAAGLVEALLLVLVVIAVVRLVDGDRPEDLATFIGYLVAAPLLVPFGVALSFAERTRWGSAIIGAACLVLPVLVLRLYQIWQSGGA